MVVVVVEEEQGGRRRKEEEKETVFIADLLPPPPPLPGVDTTSLNSTAAWRDRGEVYGRNVVRQVSSPTPA